MTVLIEVVTFRLRPGVDEDRFLRDDARLQALVSAREGFVRRTLARGSDGEWLALLLWGSAEQADASRQLIADEPAYVEFMAAVDTASMERKRFTTLD